jgi:hypothetical protein
MELKFFALELAFQLKKLEFQLMVLEFLFSGTRVSTLGT